jgi:hypothetical protein
MFSSVSFVGFELRGGCGVLYLLDSIIIDFDASLRPFLYSSGVFFSYFASCSLIHFSTTTSRGNYY